MNFSPTPRLHFFFALISMFKVIIKSLKRILILKLILEKQACTVNFMFINTPTKSAEGWGLWAERNPSLRVCSKMNSNFTSKSLFHENESCYLGHWYRWKMQAKVGYLMPYHALGLVPNRGQNLLGGGRGHYSGLRIRLPLKVG